MPKKRPTKKPVLKLPRGRSKLERTFAVNWQCLTAITGGLPGPVEEHRFADAALGRAWRFDFAWPEQLVALEIEGGIYSRQPGRHNRGKGLAADCEKYNAAVLLGWRVLRYTTDDITRHCVRVVEEVARLLREVMAAAALSEGSLAEGNSVLANREIGEPE